MNNKLLIKIFITLIGLMQINNSNEIYAQGFTLEEIKTNLWYNPPNVGDSTMREQTIISLDDILKLSYPGSMDADIMDFYTLMMKKVKAELKHSVDSETIWIMYNHGFIVQTAQLVFAFDLIPGYNGWSPYLLSDEIINKVKIVFVSHDHGDHYNSTIRDKIISKGGYVVVPVENPWMGNIPMAAGDSLTLFGLKIKAHNGEHIGPIRIYEVTTPGGLKILHTGDNHATWILPTIDSLDVLLLNGWLTIDEMRYCLNLLNPKFMIPGHIHELAHNASTRATFGPALAVDDIPVPSDVNVMAWGERLIIADEYNKIFVYGGKISSSFVRINIDTLTILSDIYNPENRNLQVNAFITSVDSVSEDSIVLFDDGNHGDSLANDGIWGNQLIPVTIEKEFKITVNMVDLDSGVYFILNDMVRFTSIGQVAFEEYTINSSDTIPNPGDRIKFKFTLRNMGMIATATNVTTNLVSLDTFAILIGNITPEYGDIIAGGISSGNQNQYIEFSENCPDTIYIQFRLDILSNDYLFWSDTFSVFVHRDPAGINSKGDIIPKDFALLQNFPNPFNPSTKIKYDLPKAGKVKIEIFNLLGQKVATLLNEQMPAGSHEIEFTAKDLPSGIYLYRIEAGSYIDTKKMLLMK
jgi:hypothetical protein